MATFVRFLGDDGVPTWGLVERSDDDGRASGTLLPDLPAEHEPGYYPALMAAMADPSGDDPFAAEPGVILSPVGRPPHILAIGLNYQDHLDEINEANAASGAPIIPQPTEPTVFVKFPASVVGHEDAIIIPRMAPSQVDYEAEFAVVIGRECRDVAPANALDYVAFCTCGHDVSARDAQLEAPNGQWVRGKSFDTFCPLGPFAATGIDPSGLNIRLILNGEAMQSSNTGNLIFDVPTLIGYLSQNMTLLPGTVIMTGTPGGVGHFMDPPVYMVPGDIAEVDIEGVGRLRNPVVGDETSGYTPTTAFAGPMPAARSVGHDDAAG
jgi:2-keto-4-pentenoate hydratase/2-oxohepta-3-ene-1,7-dioic acid hydratase in catechol pathway